MRCEEQEEDVWIKPTMSDYVAECCDCGLKHEIDFRVIRIVKEYADGTRRAELCSEEYQVEFRVRRM